MDPDRRSFLRDAAAAAAAGALFLSSVPGAEDSSPAGAPAAPRFVHRALNGWITDLATEPDPRAAWPSMRLDERLLADYREMFAVMHRVGFDEIVIWGLYVANDWPPDIRSAVPPERGLLVERLIDAAHAEGIRVLSGLGAYSWGFARIIREHPELAGTNPNALCPRKPASHEWMARVVDFVLDRFEIDGVSMQSADQGRCKCPGCSSLGDAAYHADLLRRTADLVHARKPGAVAGMSNWGIPFNDRKDREALAGMSRSLDSMIDHQDSASWGGPEHRRELIGALACPFGTSGGPVVEPPQHWERDRWLLPTCRRVHRHLGRLAADGGRACEFFFHILANPSSEVTLGVAGRTLARPERSLEDVLGESVEDLYAPRDGAARDGLMRFFLHAEEAYFRHIPGEICSTISLEPLAGDRPGPPVYLRDRLSAEARKEYARDLERLAGDLEKLRPGLRGGPRVDRLRACIAKVKADLGQAS